MADFFKQLGEFLALHGAVATAILVALGSIITVIAQIWWGKDRFDAKEAQITTLNEALTRAEQHRVQLEKIKDEQLKMKDESIAAAEKHRTEMESMKDSQLKMKDDEIETLKTMYKPTEVKADFENLRTFLEEGKKVIVQQRDDALDQKRNLEAKIQELNTQIDTKQHSPMSSALVEEQTEEREKLITLVERLEERIVNLHSLQIKTEVAEVPVQVAEKLQEIIDDPLADQNKIRRDLSAIVIKQIRSSLKLTQEQLIDALENTGYIIDLPTLHGYESGESIPPPQFFSAMQVALDLPEGIMVDFFSNASRKQQTASAANFAWRILADIVFSSGKFFP